MTGISVVGLASLRRVKLVVVVELVGSIMVVQIAALSFLADTTLYCALQV
jgi:hypothetical protein